MTPSPASARLAAVRSQRRPARGAALLVVIVSIAILTAIAVDLAYSTRVSLLSAANARDDLRAQYLARGAVQLSRLVLKLQMDLDGPAGAAPAAVPVRLQLWNFVPITNAITDGLFAGVEGGAPAPGTFDARLEDEGRKVNVQLDQPDAGGQLGGQVAALMQLVGDPRWDPLFDREDANGLRVTRTDVAVYLHDWTDLGSVGSAYTANPLKPFEDGFGDENQPYSRGDDPYRTKNARFDSLEELYLVAGIDDAFMSAFGAQLTVYPDKNGLLNVNTQVPAEMLRNARVMADPRVPQPRLVDPKFASDLAREVGTQTLGGVLALGTTQFAQIVAQLGVTVDQAYTRANAVFTDRSLVFGIHATGAVGAAERRVDAVITFNPLQMREPGEQSRLLHWREE